MAPVLVLWLLAVELQAPAPPSPAETAYGFMSSALQKAAAGDTPGAQLDFSRAFWLDPELPVPPDAPDAVRTLAEAARAQAVTGLKARLEDAARRASAAFAQPTTAPAPAPAKTAEADVAGTEQPPPPKEGLLGGKLGAGLSGLYILGDNRASPAPELSFADSYRYSRLGGVLSLMLGDALSFTAAVRLSFFMHTKIAYLGGLDAGIYYGSAHRLWAPYLMLNAGGMRFQLGPTWLEVRLLSVSIFYVTTNKSFRFAPTAGVGVVL